MVTIGCMLHLNSGKHQFFSLVFHSILTSRASGCAPPDTGVSNLQLVAIEYLPSIEGTLEIQMDVTFLRGPCRGAVSRRLTERLYQTCSDLSVSVSPSHLPWKGRLWAVLICKIIRHYGNIAIYTEHSTLRYNYPSISKETLAHPSHFWYPETS